MNISYEDIGRLDVTFPARGVTVGQVCQMGPDGVVVPCDDEDAFLGVVMSVHQDQAAVQVRGMAKVPYTGTVVPSQYALAANGTGGVCANAAGENFWVIAVDTAAKIATILL